MSAGSTGIDAQGFICTVADRPVQPEFQAMLEDVCAWLSREAQGLDGIYLYGSVANGSATPGVSDLDLTLVLREAPTSPVLAHLEALRCALEQRHSHVTKVDFDIGSRAQVLAAQNKHSWGFWLKHHCRCLWGNDLSLHFERFHPSREIAVALNGDYHAVLSAYLRRLQHPVTEQERLRLQREAARKLIRATHVLRPEYASTWPRTLEEHVAVFLQGHPTMTAHVAFFLFEARRPAAEVENFSARLQAFLGWMVAQQQ